VEEQERGKEVEGRRWKEEGRMRRTRKGKGEKEKRRS
jgi:hypothetical protein